MRSKYKSRTLIKRKKGLTLIELLLALSLMIVILGVVFTFFRVNSRSINESQIKSDLQAEGKIVMDILTANIMEAKAIDKLEFISPTDKTINSLGLKLIKLSDTDVDRVEFTLDKNEFKINKGNLSKGIASKVKYIKLTNIDASKDLDDINKTTNILKIEIMLEETKKTYDVKEKDRQYVLKNEIVLRNFDSGDRK